MENDEKEFVKKINVDKAKNRTKYAIICFIVSVLSYVMPFIVGEYDFGIVFEIATLICIFIARSHMSIYDEDGSKRYIVIAMLSIGWLLVYDIVTIVLSAYDFIDLLDLSASLILQEIFTLFGFSFLIAIYKDLRKADNPEKFKESTDWFYESLDKNSDEGENKNVWR